MKLFQLLICPSSTFFHFLEENSNRIVLTSFVRHKKVFMYFPWFAGFCISFMFIALLFQEWCCFWRYLWSRARKDFVVIRLYFVQAETSYRALPVVLRLGYKESPLGRIARSRLTLQLMSWNQNREPQSILVIDLTTKIKRIQSKDFKPKKTMKNT